MPRTDEGWRRPPLVSAFWRYRANVDVPAVSGVDPVQMTEAWDEPLSTEEVLAIVTPFLP